MDVLILINGLYMGGFSKSLVNFLKCADKYPELNITVLSLCKSVTGQESEFPKRVNYIEIPEGLQLKPEIKKGLNTRYLFNLQRLRNVEYILNSVFYKFRKKPLPDDLVKRFVQYNWIDRANRVVNDFSFVEEYDCVVSWEEGFCNYLLVDKIPAKHKIGYIHPNYREINLSKRVDKKYMHQLERIVTISKSCYDTLVSVFPEHKNKIEYLPNRLHLQTLKKNSKDYSVNFSDEYINLLTVARILDHDKAVFRIVRLVRRLLEDGFNIKWNIIGDGKDLPELRSRIEKEGLKDNIVCLGEIQNPCPYMVAADLFIMQSNREGRPVAVDEALALGTPALITRYSSAEEQIENGVTGWIVENDEDDIYQKLKYILSNPKVIETARNNLQNADNLHYEDCSGFIRMIEDVTKQ